MLSTTTDLINIYLLLFDRRGALGNYVIVRYSNHPEYGTFTVQYSHLSRVGVKVGDRVGRGVIWGYSGRSGNLGTEIYDANGKFVRSYDENKNLTPHVHIQVFKNGKWIDPAEVMPDYASDKFDMRTGKLKEQPDCPEMGGDGYKVVFPGRLFPKVNFEQERRRIRRLEDIVGREELSRLKESLPNVWE